MSGYQPGDITLKAEGQSYTLRLTLGALAEISERLDARGPQVLARKIRQISQPELQAILTALLRPVHGGSVELSDVNPGEIMPKIASLFEHAFGDVS